MAVLYMGGTCKSCSVSALKTSKYGQQSKGHIYAFWLTVFANPLRLWYDKGSTIHPVDLCYSVCYMVTQTQNRWHYVDFSPRITSIIILAHIFN